MAVAQRGQPLPSRFARGYLMRDLRRLDDWVSNTEWRGRLWHTRIEPHAIHFHSVSTLFAHHSVKLKTGWLETAQLPGSALSSRTCRGEWAGEMGQVMSGVSSRQPDQIGYLLGRRHPTSQISPCKQDM